MAAIVGTMTDRFAILLSGAVRDTPALHEALAGRRIVAADGGIAHAETLGLRPELWVGDFDSVPPGLDPSLAATPRRRADRDKDETDGELAFQALVAAGATDILVVGALHGERIDHAFSNMVLALRYAAQGLTVALFDGAETALPLGPRPVCVDCEPGAVFSVLRFGPVLGLTVKGARWPLEAVDLPFHSILTQSNEALGPIEVSLAAGEALLVLRHTEA